MDHIYEPGLNWKTSGQQNTGASSEDNTGQNMDKGQ